MPKRYAEEAVVLSLLGQIPLASPSVVAITRGRVVGLLGGFILTEFRGHRTLYSPEWSNGTELEGGRRTYEEMYAYLAPRWMEYGCHAHLVSQMANDREGLEAWQWLGFWLVSVDAVRNLGPLPGSGAGVRVRRAGPADIDDAVTLSEGLARHLARSPAFVTDVDVRDRPFYEEWLAQSDAALWLAYDGDGAMGRLA